MIDNPGKYWTDVAKKQFEGRKIVNARYMSRKEADKLGWNNRVVVLQLDDGNLIYPSMDDEGNDGGALFTNDKENYCMPVMRDESFHDE